MAISGAAFAAQGFILSLSYTIAALHLSFLKSVVTQLAMKFCALSGTDI
jgi:hypothetical protein